MEPMIDLHVGWAAAPEARRMLRPMSKRLVSPVFIGRRGALSAATEFANDVVSARASTLLVGGEAGIGKTRFSEAAAEAAQAAGILVLRGACVRLGSGELPYAPISAALRDMARELDQADLAAVVGDGDRVLERIADIGPRPRRRTTAPEPPEAARGRLLRALHGVFRRLSGLRPVLLVAEDLHWADSASLDALAFLIQSLRDARVGLLLTFRSDELHRRHPLRAWLGEVERTGSVERIELGPLDKDETRELIAAVRGGAPALEFVDEIHARADGNPLFIEELLAVEGPAGIGALTTSLRDILLARVASVPEEAQPILRVAAAAGRRIDIRLLAEVSGLAPDVLDASLEAAVGRGVLVRELDRLGDRLAFRHALIQEVIYDSLLPGERIHWHRALAQALASRLAAGHSDGPGPWAELADHWDAAHDEPRAFDAALHAAEEAAHAYAFAAALAQFRRALTGWEVIADPAAIAGFDRIELLSRAAEVAWLSGGDQVPLLREAIAEADRGNDGARGAMLRGRLGYALWVTGEPIAARRAYEEAVARLPLAPATSERAWILARLGQALMLEANHRESLRFTDAAIAMARDAGDRRIEAHALNTLAATQSELGLGSQAIETIQRALEMALDLGEPDEVGRAYLNATEILATCGLDRRAMELVRQGIDRTTAMGLTIAYSRLIGVHGAAIAYDLGRWDEAAELAAPIVDEEVDPNTEVYVLARIVPLAVGSGRWEIAAAQLARMRELLERFAAEAQYSGPYSCASAEMAVWERRPADAMAAVGWGLTRLERTGDIRHRLSLRRLGLRAAADLAAIARDRGDPSAETEAIQLAAFISERTDAAVAAVATMDGGLAKELAAEAATAAAEESRLHGTTDPAAWREAAARWSVRERPYHRAYASWRESEASLAAGDRGDARESLRTAAEIAERLGAGPLADEIAALARRARIPLERREAAAGMPDAGPDRETPLAVSEFGLTRRELDVLELLADGMTNRQIAAALFISVYTAGVHVSRILGKLDVKSRTEAASKAYRLGMVSR